MTNEQDNWTVDAMEQFGGGFVKILSELARHADPVNLLKIKNTWHEYWAEYERKGKEMQKAQGK